jgi:hypothetical protein
MDVQRCFFSCVMCLLLVAGLLLAGCDCNDDDDDDDDNNSDDDDFDFGCDECTSTTYCTDRYGEDWFCDNGCCEEKAVDDDDDVLKPAVYLYPEQTTEVSVKLILQSDYYLKWTWPLYDNGWLVTVDPFGIIDGVYPYLYYEGGGLWVGQSETGFVLSREEIFPFLEQYLEDVGFLGREIGDFLMYWTHGLPEFPWYSVLPQFDKEIDRAVSLDIDPPPDSVLRLWLTIAGYDEYPDHLDLAEPETPAFVREGFAVTEWGVIRAW